MKKAFGRKLKDFDVKNKHKTYDSVDLKLFDICSFIDIPNK